MTKLTIECADCGHSHQVTRKNARYCAVCRLFRDLLYLGARRQRCVSCDARFAPLNVNDKLCADCDLDLKGASAAGACALCEAPDASLVRAGIAVCMSCAKDPQHRDTFTRAVGKKRRQRIEARS